MYRGVIVFTSSDIMIVLLLLFLQTRLIFRIKSEQDQEIKFFLFQFARLIKFESRLIMDLPLLQSLQAMKLIEDDASRKFQTKTMELETFSPMYHNVMIVDQSLVLGPNDDFVVNVVATCAPSATGPIQLELVTNSLSKAVNHIVLPHRHFKDLPITGGWTIILKEGLYIEPFFGISPCKGSPNPPLQIVGLKEVRILYEDELANIMQTCTFINAHLTLCNVRIYDFRRLNIDVTTCLINAAHGSRLTLEHVCIYAPDMSAVGLDDNARVNLKSCSLSGCRRAFVLGGGEIHLEDCHVSKIRDHHVISRERSRITLLKTQFSTSLTTTLMLLHAGSHCTINRCRFENESDSPIEQKRLIFDLGNRAQLTCERTFFRNYDRVASAFGSGTNVTLNACVVSSCNTIGRVAENGSFNVTGCVIDSGTPLMSIALNVNGKVVFKRNRLNFSGPHIIDIDKVSKKPEHDVIPLFSREIYAAPSTMSNKKRSKHTKALKKKAQNLKTDYDLFNNPERNKFKHCHQCLRYEDNEALMKWSHGVEATAKEKFRYCGRCKIVAYCSEECKNAHWPDHRLTCKRQNSS